MKSHTNAAGSDLTLEERNLLSVAYKNVVGARRASLRIVGSIMEKEKEKGSDKAKLVEHYKASIETELDNANLQRVPSIIRKCIQCYESKLTRHGNMLVGASLGGKTTAWTVLSKAM